MGIETGKVHGKVLQSIYRSPKSDNVINLRILVWALHVARMVEGRSSFQIQRKEYKAQVNSNIRMVLKKQARRLIDQAQYKGYWSIMNAALNVRVSLVLDFFKTIIIIIIIIILLYLCLINILHSLPLNIIYCRFIVLKTYFT